MSVGSGIFLSDLGQPNIIPADKVNVSLCVVQPKSHLPVLVECTMRFVRLHLGTSEIIPLKKKIILQDPGSIVMHRTLGLC